MGSRSNITAEITDIAQESQARIDEQHLPNIIHLLSQEILEDLINLIWKNFRNLAGYTTRKKYPSHQFNILELYEYCAWLNEQHSFFQKNSSYPINKLFTLALKTPTPLITWLNTAPNMALNEYLSTFNPSAFLMQLERSYYQQKQQHYQKTPLQFPTREQFIQQAKQLGRPFAKEAWSLLRQSLNNDQLILKVNLRSIEGVYVELFAQDSNGKKYYLTGFTHSPPSLTQWYQCTNYPNLNQMNSQYPYCELPAKKIPVTQLLNTLSQKGLIFRTELEQDLAYLIDQFNPGSNLLPRGKHLMFLKKLEKMGYSIFPLFYSFIKETHLPSLTHAKTIGDIQTWLRQHPKLEQTTAQQFIKKYLFLRPKPQLKLDKFYFTQHLSCAALAKTIFNITDHQHFTPHWFPFIGPIEAISAIAKMAYQELIITTKNFTQVTENLRQGLTQKGITDAIQQQLVLLHWRLELHVQAIKGGGLRQLWPHSTQKKYLTLSQITHPLNSFSTISSEDLLQITKELLNDNNINNLNPFKPNHTKNRLHLLCQNQFTETNQPKIT